MPELNVDVRLNHTISNREPYQYAELKVTDKASGNVVLSVKLSPEDLYDVLSGRGTFSRDVTAWTPTPDEYAHLGKECHSFSRLFQVDRDKMSYGSPGSRTAGDNPDWHFWRERVQADLGFHSSSWRDQNNGKAVIFWYYGNDLDPVVKANMETDLAALEPPRGLK